MYLSRIRLRLEQLQPVMLQKWDAAAPYASHQWLWQLFPDQDRRQFLFRQEDNGQFFMLSAMPPLTGHALLAVETRPFRPQLAQGAVLDFQLRANPVVTRQGKRSDVMMDAKYQAKARGVPREQWWGLQQQAAQSWLERQGEQHGFRLLPAQPASLALWAGDDDTDVVDSDCVKGYQQHSFTRKQQEAPVTYSSVDFAGTLQVTNVALFGSALFNGIGKSKALGCGMLMVKRGR
ncbi:type I-E CRISPR-associated protein Cas6/Cse3/CasE [Shimwellia blattae]|uniref:Putative CRISPR-associated protein n=1 Tax=Shimwellia blattae (strain ATCC 29907 / DSM 4481 / JCM 1650 / NBRC 105725 / CDC 9005-74) TaxID=630626 RepID=I2BC80_SHIBC|nr:type I-E CRISPR-associated protein Cas6/Cse3/CasE [Shimwellia blattae]AFJ48134.1 putative CRISPR-associated protein [Shimwellia blattae DSM 4481 = NBRC 105725]GAB81882.1 putative CRISPR-associated protein [Shimwellia blattae DSM 4481 = NBRC 105725]VDY65630.1 CRISPR-associated protein Cas6/Cse3/CasE, subtype I-E/ECOLI [Shimwellia blattae]VEC25154.1 CRISPR-associated protein Cas6/Cse3/CasE, subtype I-E/ECOLI [Shimwellia blattae]